MIDIYEKLKRFDVVLAHTFKVMTGNQEGAVLPNFMEYQKYNEALRYTQNIARMGCLDIIYERIMRGAIWKKC